MYSYPREGRSRALGQLDAATPRQALRRHARLCELLQYSVHFPTQALSQSRPMISQTCSERARALFRAAALERHEVYASDDAGAPSRESLPARRHAISDQGESDDRTGAARPTGLAASSRVVVARWQHGPRCLSTLRRDAPVFIPGIAITA